MLNLYMGALEIILMRIQCLAPEYVPCSVLGLSFPPWSSLPHRSGILTVMEGSPMRPHGQLSFHGRLEVMVQLLKIRKLLPCLFMFCFRKMQARPSSTPAKCSI